MRTLLYVPIIHMSADLGSLAENFTSRGIRDLGAEVWEEHKKTVSKFWDAITVFFENLPAAGLKVYQDGMVADGEMAKKIIEEGARSGSPNYELLRRLAGRGALIVKTEDPTLVKEERDWMLRIAGAATLTEKIKAYLGFRRGKNNLLKRRDGYMAVVINATLGPDERGALFIGAYHEIIPLLDLDIAVMEVKEVRKVREYQKRLPYRRGKKEKDALFKELADYLVKPV